MKISGKEERFVIISMFFVAMIFIIVGFSIEAKNDQKQRITTLPAVYRQFSISAQAYSPQH